MDIYLNIEMCDHHQDHRIEFFFFLNIQAGPWIHFPGNAYPIPKSTPLD